MRNSFTLIELIVVIAIIAVLAAIIAPNAFRTIEKAKIARAISEIKVIKAAAVNYCADVGGWPGRYVPTDPVSHNPFLNDPAVSGFDPDVTGWNGPYLDKWQAHPWGGAITWNSDVDWDGSGGLDILVTLNDDRPGMPSTDNKGRVPTEAMEKIDAALDDGNLSTGRTQGDGLGFGLPVGELGVMVISDGNPI